MGGKRVGARQQIFLYLALLTMAAGCGLLRDARDRGEVRDAMLQGQAFFAGGDFAAALKEYQRVMSLARELPPADLASFNIGLIHAHPRNPKRNPQKAIEAFRWVNAQHGESPWADQARIWIGVLEEQAQAKREAEEAKRELGKSKQVLDQTRRELEKSRQTAEQAKQELEKAKQVMEKSRQVDIEIEQKRRIRGK